MTKSRKVVVTAKGPSALAKSMVRQATSRFTRNEGHSLPIVSAHDGDRGFTQMGVDIASAPVPQRRYASDLCLLSWSGTDIKFIFAQQGILDDGSLDSALSIRMNPTAAGDFLRAVERMSDPSLDEMVSAMQLQHEELGVITTAPKQTASLIANLVAVGIAGHETCLDFYHASAFAMRDITSSSSLSVEPVVRVDLRTSAFVSLIAELRNRVKSN